MNRQIHLDIGGAVVAPEEFSIAESLRCDLKLKRKI
jgi:hypothetical protein